MMYEAKQSYHCSFILQNALKIKLCISEVFLGTQIGPDSSVTISVCELVC
jgi:hypothetical protein